MSKQFVIEDPDSEIESPEQVGAETVKAEGVAAVAAQEQPAELQIIAFHQDEPHESKASEATSTVTENQAVLPQDMGDLYLVDKTVIETLKAVKGVKFNAFDAFLSELSDLIAMWKNAKTEAAARSRAMMILLLIEEFTRK